MSDVQDATQEEKDTDDAEIPTLPQAFPEGELDFTTWRPSSKDGLCRSLHPLSLSSFGHYQKTGGIQKTGGHGRLHAVDSIYQMVFTEIVRLAYR